MGIGRRQLLLVSNNRPDYVHTRMAEHKTGARGTGYSFDRRLGHCCVPLHRTHTRWAYRVGDRCNHVIRSHSVYRDLIFLSRISFFIIVAQRSVMSPIDVPTPSDRHSWLQRTAKQIQQPLFYWAICAAFLASSVQRGPDFMQYLDWSRAAVHGDIFLLDSFVESPQGVPLSQWCAGPGLASATAVALCETFGPLGFVAKHGVFVTAAFFSMVFWWSFTKLLATLTGGQRSTVLYGLCAGFLGTHLGYYSITSGSELLALAPVSVLAVELVQPMYRRANSVILVGCCTAILIMIRPYLVLYALPTLTMTAVRLLQEPRILLRISYLFLLASPLVASCFQVGQVNSWMTGEWTQSPYVFGNHDFHSFDFTSPEIMAVLFHPLHGWLIYHPLYALGFVAASVLVMTATDRRERLLWATSLLLVGIHLLIQSAWYCWWLAADWSFGMRGMTPAAIPAIAAIARLYTQISQRHTSHSCQPKSLTIIRTITVLCCLWSWLLMIQGITAFHSYTALMEAQWSSLQMNATSGGTLLGPYVDPYNRIISLSFAGLFAFLSLGKHALATSPENEPAQRNMRVSGQPFTNLLLATFVLDYLVWGWLANTWGLVQYATLVGALALLVLTTGRWQVERFQQAMPAVASAATALVFTLMLVWFVRVAFPTEAYLASGSVAPRSFRWKTDFYVPAAQGHYEELLLLASRESKKQKLRQFLAPYGPKADGRLLSPSTSTP